MPPAPPPRVTDRDYLEFETLKHSSRGVEQRVSGFATKDAAGADDDYQAGSRRAGVSGGTKVTLSPSPTGTAAIAAATPTAATASSASTTMTPSRKSIANDLRAFMNSLSSRRIGGGRAAASTSSTQTTRDGAGAVHPVEAQARPPTQQVVEHHSPSHSASSSSMSGRSPGRAAFFEDQRQQAPSTGRGSVVSSGASGGGGGVGVGLNNSNCTPRSLPSFPPQAQRAEGKENATGTGTKIRGGTRAVAASTGGRAQLAVSTSSSSSSTSSSTASQHSHLSPKTPPSPPNKNVDVQRTTTSTSHMELHQLQQDESAPAVYFSSMLRGGSRVGEVEAGSFRRRSSGGGPAPPGALQLPQHEQQTSLLSPIARFSMVMDRISEEGEFENSEPEEDTSVDSNPPGASSIRSSELMNNFSQLTNVGSSLAGRRGNVSSSVESVGVGDQDHHGRLYVRPRGLRDEAHGFGGRQEAETKADTSNEEEQDSTTTLAPNSANFRTQEPHQGPLILPAAAALVPPATPPVRGRVISTSATPQAVFVKTTAADRNRSTSSASSARRRKKARTLGAGEMQRDGGVGAGAALVAKELDLDAGAVRGRGAPIRYATATSGADADSDGTDVQLASPVELHDEHIFHQPKLAQRKMRMPAHDGECHTVSSHVRVEGRHTRTPHSMMTSNTSDTTPEHEHVDRDAGRRPRDTTNHNQQSQSQYVNARLPPPVVASGASSSRSLSSDAGCDDVGDGAGLSTNPRNSNSLHLSTPELGRGSGCSAAVLPRNTGSGPGPASLASGRGPSGSSSFSSGAPALKVRREANQNHHKSSATGFGLHGDSAVVCGVPARRPPPAAETITPAAARTVSISSTNGGGGASATPMVVSGGPTSTSTSTATGIGMVTAPPHLGRPLSALSLAPQRQSLCHLLAPALTSHRHRGHPILHNVQLAPSSTPTFSSGGPRQPPAALSSNAHWLHEAAAAGAPTLGIAAGDVSNAIARERVGATPNATTAPLPMNTTSGPLVYEPHLEHQLRALPIINGGNINFSSTSENCFFRPTLFVPSLQEGVAYSQHVAAHLLPDTASQSGSNLDSPPGLGLRCRDGEQEVALPRSFPPGDSSQQAPPPATETRRGNGLMRDHDGLATTAQPGVPPAAAQHQSNSFCSTIPLQDSSFGADQPLSHQLQSPPTGEDVADRECEGPKSSSSKDEIFAETKEHCPVAPGAGVRSNSAAASLLRAAEEQVVSILDLRNETHTSGGPCRSSSCGAAPARGRAQSVVRFRDDQMKRAVTDVYRWGDDDAHDKIASSPRRPSELNKSKSEKIISEIDNYRTSSSGQHTSENARRTTLLHIPPGAPPSPGRAEKPDAIAAADRRSAGASPLQDEHRKIGLRHGDDVDDEMNAEATGWLSLIHEVEQHERTNETHRYNQSGRAGEGEPRDSSCTTDEERLPARVVADAAAAADHRADRVVVPNRCHTPVTEETTTGASSSSGGTAAASQLVSTSGPLRHAPPISSTCASSSSRSCRRATTSACSSGTSIRRALDQHKVLCSYGKMKGKDAIDDPQLYIENLKLRSTLIRTSVAAASGGRATSVVNAGRRCDAEECTSTVAASGTGCGSGIGKSRPAPSGGGVPGEISPPAAASASSCSSAGAVLLKPHPHRVVDEDVVITDFLTSATVMTTSSSSAEPPQDTRAATSTSKRETFLPEWIGRRETTMPHQHNAQGQDDQKDEQDEQVLGNNLKQEKDRSWDCEAQDQKTQRPHEQYLLPSSARMLVEEGPEMNSESGAAVVVVTSKKGKVHLHPESNSVPNYQSATSRTTSRRNSTDTVNLLLLEAESLSPEVRPRRSANTTKSPDMLALAQTQAPSLPPPVPCIRGMRLNRARSPEGRDHNRGARQKQEKRARSATTVDAADAGAAGGGTTPAEGVALVADDVEGGAQQGQNERESGDESRTQPASPGTTQKQIGMWRRGKTEAETEGARPQLSVPFAAWAKTCKRTKAMKSSSSLQVQQQHHAQGQDEDGSGGTQSKNPAERPSARSKSLKVAKSRARIHHGNGCESTAKTPAPPPPAEYHAPNLVPERPASLSDDTVNGREIDERRGLSSRSTYHVAAPGGGALERMMQGSTVTNQDEHGPNSTKNPSRLGVAARGSCPQAVQVDATLVRPHPQGSVYEQTPLPDSTRPNPSAPERKTVQPRVVESVNFSAIASTQSPDRPVSCYQRTMLLPRQTTRPINEECFVQDQRVSSSSPTYYSYHPPAPTRTTAELHIPRDINLSTLKRMNGGSIILQQQEYSRDGLKQTHVVTSTSTTLGRETTQFHHDNFPRAGAEGTERTSRTSGDGAPSYIEPPGVLATFGSRQACISNKNLSQPCLSPCIEHEHDERSDNSLRTTTMQNESFGGIVDETTSTATGQEHENVLQQNQMKQEQYRQASAPVALARSPQLQGTGTRSTAVSNCRDEDQHDEERRVGRARAQRGAADNNKQTSTSGRGSASKATTPASRRGTLHQRGRTPGSRSPPLRRDAAPRPGSGSGPRARAATSSQRQKRSNSRHTSGAGRGGSICSRSSRGSRPSRGGRDAAINKGRNNNLQSHSSQHSTRFLQRELQHDSEVHYGADLSETATSVSNIYEEQRRKCQGLPPAKSKRRSRQDSTTTRITAGERSTTSSSTAATTTRRSSKTSPSPTGAALEDPAMSRHRDRSILGMSLVSSASSVDDTEEGEEGAVPGEQVDSMVSEEQDQTSDDEDQQSEDHHDAAARASGPDHDDSMLDDEPEAGCSRPHGAPRQQAGRRTPDYNEEARPHPGTFRAPSAGGPALRGQNPVGHGGNPATSHVQQSDAASSCLSGRFSSSSSTSCSAGEHSLTSVRTKNIHHSTDDIPWRAMEGSHRAEYHRYHQVEKSRQTPRL